MANIQLSGNLWDPVDETPDVGAVMRFTHKSTTGNTIKNAVSEVVFPAPDAAYNITLEYGLVQIEYKTDAFSQYKNLGIVTVNQDQLATDLPGLLNAIVPPTDEQLLEFQAILADCVAAKDAAEAAQAAAEDAAERAEDAAETFKLLPSPDVSIPLGNKIVDTLSGPLTFSRLSGTGNVNKSSAVESLLDDEPAITKDGLSIYESYTNYFTTPQSPVTQSIALSAGDYTLWCIGDGSATVSYGSATEGFPLTFTSAGESLTVTISGTLEIVNLINLLTVAPPVLDDSVATRAEELASIATMNNLPAPGKPFSIVFNTLFNQASGSVLSTSTFTASSGLKVFFLPANNSFRTSLSDGTSFVTLQYALPELTKSKFAVVFTGSELLLYVKGAVVASVAIATSSYDLISDLRIGRSGASTDYLNSELEGFKIYHRALTAAQVAQLGDV